MLSIQPCYSFPEHWRIFVPISNLLLDKKDYQHELIVVYHSVYSTWI